MFEKNNVYVSILILILVISNIGINFHYVYDYIRQYYPQSNLSGRTEFFSSNYTRLLANTSNITTYMPHGIVFHPNGKTMWFVDGDEWVRYNLSIPWNITIAIYIKNGSIEEVF